ncbi:hypothetical protein [Cellulomonas cellasea]|uniref:Uncharacterized protein n=2 Tax=Cellulomonas cellasea TaxID=43670 RepID=A0A0A0BEJ0_9CELL|nr:hypothetical protein [Cellulomonas cellasea]KGM03766.1 hypothetical protein Q760_13615 [Cellulomonas cellasea DSM 20118]GEA86888.1 hypothetical protein CCE01nite_08370 [Cellulomonas cellasea]
MGSEGPHPPARAARGGTGDGAAPRHARAAGASDARASRARELHRKAAEADEVAARHRAERDRLILQLRAEDPERWTYTTIAAVLGCSRELVALIARRGR